MGGLPGRARRRLRARPGGGRAPCGRRALACRLTRSRHPTCPAPPPARRHRLRVADVALFYGERSGGIRTYLEAKAAFARLTALFERHLSDRVLGSLLAAVDRHGFREYYDPITGRGLAARSFGFSTLLIDLLARCGTPAGEPSADQDMISL